MSICRFCDESFSGYGSISYWCLVVLGVSGKNRKEKDSGRKNCGCYFDLGVYLISISAYLRACDG